MYYDKRKVLFWIGDPEETRISDYGSAHQKLDQLSYRDNCIKN